MSCDELNSSLGLSISEKRWFAVKVKYKCEKLVCERLIRQGIDAYVPILETVKEYTHKRKIVSKPIIHSFVFVRILESEYVSVLKTLHVYSFLKIGNSLICIPQEEMNLLKHVVGEFQDVFVEERNFDVGQPVEIVHGNLTGLTGKLIEKKNKNEFIVEIPSLGLQLRIELNKVFLRPLVTKQLA